MMIAITPSLNASNFPLVIYFSNEHFELRTTPCARHSRSFEFTLVQGIFPCDFFVSVAAGLRIQYVFVALEIESRRLVHFNVTEHPTADWTLLQFRETLPGDQDSSFSFMIGTRLSPPTWMRRLKLGASTY
jgi:hypothetical protein